MTKLQRNLIKTEALIARLENAVLIASFVLMIFLGSMQVFLRNAFNTGVEWADVFVRALVLWVGFTGASLATRRSRHINIDIFSKLLTNDRLKMIRKRVVNFISLVISALLFKASVEFLITEMDSNMTAFLNIPTWIVFIIVPVSLFVITLRLLVHSITNAELEEEKS
ncbi:MAG: TRAP transporter small permease [Oligoflexia bacterium]|nr:TRAP transporter small permease [Oligoflexia bacterium]